MIIMLTLYNSSEHFNIIIGVLVLMVASAGAFAVLKPLPHRAVF